MRRPSSPDRPMNVVWICADDFAPYVSGAYGNRLARTPNLDRLAAEGVRFDRAYCSCPLSTPSRMAFLTGRYPRSVGVTLTGSRLPRNEPTIGRRLRDAGYEATAFGKTHYYEPLDREFDHCVDHFEHELWIANGPSHPIPDGVEVLGPWRPFHDPASVWLNAAALPYAADSAIPDTFFTRLAALHLEEDHPKPFFLWVGFYVTHSPFRFPVEFRGRFDPASFAAPELGPDDAEMIPAVFRDLTDADRRGITAAYYTSVEYMDRNLGRILDALDRSGRADDTLVVFNSDHGYLLGQHGRYEKHCCYEEAVRSALVIRGPGVAGPGRGSDALVELIDVAPTILELCGVDRPPTLQGRSLAALLAGSTDRHRDHVVSEYADNAEAMVRTERWKLIYSAGNRRRRDGYAIGLVPPGPSIRLYDLRNDPCEHRNVAASPENAEVVAALLATLGEHVRRTDRDAERLAETGDLHDLLALGLPPGPGS